MSIGKKDMETYKRVRKELMRNDLLTSSYPQKRYPNLQKLSESEINTLIDTWLDIHDGDSMYWERYWGALDEAAVVLNISQS